MRSQLDIHTEQEGPALIITLAGMLDGHTCPQLDEFCSGDLIYTSQHIIIDLLQLSYVSSAGISIFIGLQQSKRARNGSVHLLNPSAAVAEVFNLLGLQALFHIHGSREAAVAAIKAGFKD
ncbi:MAG: anti-sigma factor antagonist [Planctomycetota bacterium]|nr:MAG: anti-sigma factor antagonist [Planctomycetota bacterium]